MEITGNLCRCTGYRPILDGFKSFCKVGNCCQQRKDATECENGIKRASRDVLFDASAFKAYDPSQDPIFPPELMVTSDLIRRFSMTFHFFNFNFLFR